MMREFTMEELACFDGRDGRPAFFAYEGKVYDASGSFLWRNGRHQVIHQAGTDLTDALVDAPHGADLIGRCPVVGILID
ncbi:MAG: cytochrome B5 [Armatimonadetes bacterium]|nr:cytochrome B5 [Armatimonadota bacterium]